LYTSDGGDGSEGNVGGLLFGFGFWVADESNEVTILILDFGGIGGSALFNTVTFFWPSS